MVAFTIIGALVAALVGYYGLIYIIRAVHWNVWMIAHRARWQSALPMFWHILIEQSFDFCEYTRPNGSRICRSYWPKWMRFLPFVQYYEVPEE